MHDPCPGFAAGLFFPSGSVAQLVAQQTFNLLVEGSSPSALTGDPMKPKILKPDERQRVVQEIKMLLHASRDCARTIFSVDTNKQRFDVTDGYYGEAFGILRGLSLLGYGSFGAVNTPEEESNFSWWMHKLEDEVLVEENFGGSNECDHCLEKYHKDGAGRRRPFTAGRNPAAS